MSPLRQFVLQALLWLPLCFFLWFVLDSAVVWPSLALAKPVIAALLPNGIAEMTQLGSTVEIETRVLVAAGSAGQQGALMLYLRPLIYAWPLPLFAGLVMATPLSARRRLLQLAIGFPLLWLVAAWGSVFDVLKLFAFDAGPLGAAHVARAGLSPDAVALGYQFGYLILPAVVPVATWVVLNRQFLEELVGWREPQAAAAGPSPGSSADLEGKS